MKRTAKARARWHIPPAALARCLDPRNLSATTVKATPDPTVRLIGSRYEGQSGVAPRRGENVGVNARRRYTKVGTTVTHRSTL
jgi:hypothetical protein